MQAGRVLWIAGLGVLAGTALQLQQRVLWPLEADLGLLAVALAAVLVSGRWRVRWAQALWVGAAAVAIGFGLTDWRAAVRLSDTLPEEFEGRDIDVTGVVASLPQFHVDGVRFQFAVEAAQLSGRPAPVPQLVSLGWYSAVRGASLTGSPQAGLRAGQRWRFTVRLRQPHGNLNPHGFDYELWLFEQGVRATGYVRNNPGAPAQVLDERAGNTLDRTRQAVRDAIYQRVSDPRAAGMLAALAVGDQAAIGFGQ